MDRSHYLTRTRIAELLDRHRLAPSRALGQNFLCDPNTVDKIVRLAGVGPGDRVVEIGAGLGSLTVGLCAAGARVLAIEVDRYLIPALTEVVAVASSEAEGCEVTIVCADARELDWDAHLGGRSWTVVANLPYNIATPLVLDLLAAQPGLRRWLVMVQREVGERLVAHPGSRIYGIPSVLTAYWGRARIVASVGTEVFLPRPRVTSVLVEIERHTTPAVDVPYARVAELVRAGFGQRRKMVRRSLAGLVSPDQFESVGILPTARAEQLDLEAWASLARVAT
jgi:16S rRNA (adenine1518-N6/adenine1519-N6)-dimethyltransferase